jgi:hypothetical protein
VRVEPSEEDPWLQGVVIEAGPEQRRARAITQLLEPWTAPQS